MEAASSLSEESVSSLNLNYYTLDGQEQYWSCIPGDEAWVSNPMDDSGLREYITGFARQAANEGQPASVPPDGLLARLPNEVMLQTFMDLSWADIKKTITSRGTKFSELPSSFINAKIHKDNPWLWDLPELDNEHDWLDILVDIEYRTSGDTKSNEQLLVLANRRRIWNVSLQLLDVYLEKQSHLSRLKSTDIEHGIHRNTV